MKDDILIHHGVKGQKWGIRRYERINYRKAYKTYSTKNISKSRKKHIAAINKVLSKIEKERLKQINNVRKQFGHKKSSDAIQAMHDAKVSSWFATKDLLGTAYGFNPKLYSNEVDIAKSVDLSRVGNFRKK